MVIDVPRLIILQMILTPSQQVTVLEQIKLSQILVNSKNWTESDVLTTSVEVSFAAVVAAGDPNSFHLAIGEYSATSSSPSMDYTFYKVCMVYRYNFPAPPEEISIVVNNVVFSYLWNQSLSSVLYMGHWYLNWYSIIERHFYFIVTVHYYILYALLYN